MVTDPLSLSLICHAVLASIGVGVRLLPFHTDAFLFSDQAPSLGIGGLAHSARLGHAFTSGNTCRVTVFLWPHFIPDDAAPSASAAHVRRVAFIVEENSVFFKRAIPRETESIKVCIGCGQQKRWIAITCEMGRSVGASGGLCGRTTRVPWTRLGRCTPSGPGFDVPMTTGPLETRQFPETTVPVKTLVSNPLAVRHVMAWLRCGSDPDLDLAGRRH